MKFASKFVSTLHFVQDFQKIWTEFQTVTCSRQIVQNNSLICFPQEFKKSLRMQDTVPHMATKRTLFRTSQSLGSLGTPVSTPKTKSPGIPTINLRKTSRSEDVLDRKEELDDSDETVSESETEDEGSSQNSKSESHVSPFLAKSRSK